MAVGVLQTVSAFLCHARITRAIVLNGKQHFCTAIGGLSAPFVSKRLGERIVSTGIFGIQQRLAEILRIDDRIRTGSHVCVQRTQVPTCSQTNLRQQCVAGVFGCVTITGIGVAHLLVSKSLQKVSLDACVDILQRTQRIVARGTVDILCHVRHTTELLRQDVVAVRADKTHLGSVLRTVGVVVNAGVGHIDTCVQVGVQRLDVRGLRRERIVVEDGCLATRGYIQVCTVLVHAGACYHGLHQRVGVHT